MNKAGMASSNRTGLVLKISLAFLVLLGLLVYKLNDYFLNDKTFAMQGQIRKGVLGVKTSVSSQLAQLKNSLSSYETDFNESTINWVQLDPFFLIAKVENQGGQLKVAKLVARTNTPAERWNAAYLEKALSINRSSDASPILIQLFKDRANAKFILTRFNVGDNHELVLASTADYFQKYFDLERGSRNKSLLITTENILAGHTEADYIATSSKEASLPPTKYIIEKEEIVGTNLISIGYVLKSKIVSGFAIPWSILGLVLGCGFILIGILFYNLDPIERRVERYKKQERAQIYKDTVQQATASLAVSGEAALDIQNEDTVKKVINLDNPNFKGLVNSDADDLVEKDQFTMSRTYTAPIFSEEPAVNEPPENKASSDNGIIDLLERATPRATPTAPVAKKNEERAPVEIEKPEPLKSEEEFVTLDEEKIDLDEIEKALALDDLEDSRPALNTSAEALEKNLKPQKISVAATGAPVDKPQFVFDKKDFKVDEVKINIRRPERS